MIILVSPPAWPITSPVIGIIGVATIRIVISIAISVSVPYIGITTSTTIAIHSTHIIVKVRLHVRGIDSIEARSHPHWMPIGVVIWRRYITHTSNMASVLYAISTL